MIYVVNKKQYKGEGEYIGRPSLLGNPFSHLSKSAASHKVESVEEAIFRYEKWLKDELIKDGPVKRQFDLLVKKYKSTGELILICWCKPSPCHGDVIRKLILEHIEREQC